MMAAMVCSLAFIIQACELRKIAVSIPTVDWKAGEQSATSNLLSKCDCRSHDYHMTHLISVLSSGWQYLCSIDLALKTASQYQQQPRGRKPQDCRQAQLYTTAVS